MAHLQIKSYATVAGAPPPKTIPHSRPKAPTNGSGCTHCDNPKHTHNTCFKMNGYPNWWEDLRARKLRETTSSNCGYVFRTSDLRDTTGWIIDYGATDPMTFDPNDFLHTITPRRTSIANVNGVTYPVTGVGTDILTKEIIGRDFEKKRPFARDRIMELYFWIVGVYFESHYMATRKILTRLIALVSVLDDIYDAFGTYEELVIFTGAVERWDVNCMDELPDYMQVFYHTHLNVYDEIEEEMAEAQWLHKDYIPSMEEYKSVATAYVGNTLLSITSLVGIGDVVTKEAFEWLLNDPRILRASNIIFRLIDELSGYEFEKERACCF
ncbi:hypothetical protein L3X38_023611 [Prunus dulcis]|uniref:Terpene synthase metal-binding domain-containing protein n=1 Tax=Prunus dulcis TaxID=3755 RepID=A0AAD4VYA5_PRUDU|nr:hypothetical protein L3X38_023611 [Prunus dulcis]